MKNIPRECWDMIEDMKPIYTSMILGGADEDQIFRWLGKQIQELYKAGYPDVLVCSELSGMIG